MTDGRTRSEERGARILFRAREPASDSPRRGTNACGFTKSKRGFSIFNPRSSIFHPRFSWWLAVSAVLIAAAPAGAWDEVVESVMYRSPELPKPREIKVFPKGLKDLWLEALRRPEADQQCQAALTIALAHRY